MQNQKSLGPAYPAAREMATRVHPHFACHLAVARLQNQQNLATEPSVEDIEQIISVAFWASLRREEGYIPKISFAFLSTEQARPALVLDRLIPLTPEALTRVAPAVERPGIHLGIWKNGEELSVWGTTRDVPAFCFVLEVIAPGLLVIKHSRAFQTGKFVNVAVLESDKIKVLNQQAPDQPNCPALVTSLLGFESPASSGNSLNVLVQLAVSMRAHGRGGSLLVVPTDADPEAEQCWRKSILHPIRYAVSPPFVELSDLMRASPEEQKQRWWQESVRRAVDTMAGLTAVDGATVISDDYQLLAFGAKIRRREGCSDIESVVMTEPIQGASDGTVHPMELGGTRHLSAAQFIHDQREAVALVASQDGRFTVFSWSECDARVHAHRVETLLL